MIRRFRDRTEAGQLLASRLSAYANKPDVIVLALPRGGVPVAYQVAKTLNLPLDVFIVRKLGVPEQRELAMGAIATGGMIVFDHQLIKLLKIPDQIIYQVVQEEQRELDRRESRYRNGRQFPELAGRTAILVDDGIATGATMLVAVRALREHKLAHIVVAVPVAPPSVCETLAAEAVEVVCLMTPQPFTAVGLWYNDFSELTDEEVSSFLEMATIEHLSPVSG
ncbi:MAG: phosphoribosyltransferase [Acidobacteriota bacterium]